MTSKAIMPWGVSLLLASFVLVSSALPCPFIQSIGVEHTGMPCCPREPAPARECPLSKTIETCPFFVTEAKIGIAQAKPHPGPVIAALPAFEAQTHGARSTQRPATPQSRVIDAADTYLHIRVLRI